MRTPPVIRERRTPEGRGKISTSARSGPTRKRRSAKSLRFSRKHRLRGRRLVAILALLFLFGVGYSLLGLAEEGIASAIRPSAPAAALSKEMTRKPPAPATTCDDLGVLVDRSHPLPSDYVPKDLVPLQDYGVPTLGSETLRRDPAEHLGRLVESAEADGEELVVASAYRSYEEQQISHERLASVYGADADGMSAPPGHSQHQLGTAVDLTNAAAGYQVWLPFGETTAYWWLQHHAQEHGFVLAYPRGKEAQTGYRWEPWHYRYVGVENAKRLEESGLSLQAFLEREGIMPHC